jgi:hypothetical protein
MERIKVIIDKIRKLGFDREICRDTGGEVILVKYTRDDHLITFDDKDVFKVQVDNSIIFFGLCSLPLDLDRLDNYVKRLNRSEVINKIIKQ